MNVGLVQALEGIQQVNSVGNNSQSGNVGQGFGSVLSSIRTNSSTSLSYEDNGRVTEELVLSILNSTTEEELYEALKSVESQPSKVHNQLENVPFKSLDDLDLEAIVQSILPLLEQVGLSEGELLAASYAPDIWSLLDIIENVTPKLFTEIMNGLEGKGGNVKDQAVELLTLLKKIAITAPKTDLLMKHEQQVFSLQSFLTGAAEQLESQSTSTRPKLMPLMEAHQIIRIDMQKDTTNGSMKDTPKETAQQSVPSLFATRSEVPLAELENRNSARNETLLREMQAIFKRSNFGQTGGTNRLLIKLYPEHLGQVRIELLQTNGILTARILASTALGKEMLDSQLHQLRSAFLQQNLQVERIDITQTLQDATRNERQQHAFNQHFKNGQDGTEEHEGSGEEDEMTFQEYMIELEV